MRVEPTKITRAINVQLEQLFRGMVNCLLPAWGQSAQVPPRGPPSCLVLLNTDSESPSVHGPPSPYTRCHGNFLDGCCMWDMTQLLVN